MIIAHNRPEGRIESAAAGASLGADELFDPVIRAVMLCDGVGREKTIAIVVSAVEQAFPR